MLHNLFDRAMAVPVRIFEQFTELTIRQTLPDHRRRGRWQLPTGCSRRHVPAHEIVILMAGAACDGIHALPAWSAENLHGMAMAVVTLTGKVSMGVTIHTARMTKHGDQGFESSRSAIVVGQHDFTPAFCFGMFRRLTGSPNDEEG
jgi:hypothetical protein